MNKWRICILLAALSGVMVGCRPTDAVVEALMPRHFFFSREEIQAKIAERWNFDKKVLGLFQLKIDTPVVSLSPESNRLRCAFKLLLRRPLGSNLEGGLTVLGRLKFDPISRSIVLVDTHVDALNAQGEASNDPLLKTIAGLFGGTLTDIKLYEMKPEDLRYGGVLFDPVAFTVKEKGVDVELQPRTENAPSAKETVERTL